MVRAKNLIWKPQNTHYLYRVHSNCQDFNTTICWLDSSFSVYILTTQAMALPVTKLYFSLHVTEKSRERESWILQLNCSNIRQKGGELFELLPGSVWNTLVLLLSLSLPYKCSVVIRRLIAGCYYSDQTPQIFSTISPNSQYNPV